MDVYTRVCIVPFYIQVDLGTWCPNGSGSSKQRIRLRHDGDVNLYSATGLVRYNFVSVITIISYEDGTEVFIDGTPVQMVPKCTSSDDVNLHDHKASEKASHWTMAKGFWIGKTGYESRGFTGEIGDFLVYSKALSAAERYAAEAPLLNKYLR